MGDSYEIRITRYTEEGAFERVAAFLAQLFPDRSADELKAGLAVTPVLVSHRATKAAADALVDALTDMGVTVKIAAASQEQPTDGAIEIGADFFAERRRQRQERSQQVRPMRTRRPDAPKAPWEED